MTRFYKWVTGSAELLLGIPLVGGAYIIGMGWTPLAAMLIIHIMGLILSMRRKSVKNGHVIGIAASILGVIPIVGMVLHLTTGFVLIYEAIKEEQELDKEKKIKVIDVEHVEVEEKPLPQEEKTEGEEKNK